MLNFYSLFQFVNVIVHHAFPTKDSLLFAYEFGLNNKANGMYNRLMDFKYFPLISQPKPLLWVLKRTVTMRSLLD